MWKLLFWNKKNLTLTIPLAMVLGILYGYYINASGFRQLILPVTLMMVYPMMVTIELKKILSRCDLRLQLTTQAINFILLPLIGFLLGRLFFPDSPYLALGLLLIALLPTSGMTITWTSLSGGDLNTAVKMSVFGLILGALLVPLYSKIFLGSSVPIPAGKIIFQIMIVIFMPLILGQLTRFLLVRSTGEEKFNKKLKPKFGLFSSFAVVVMIFLSTALKAKSIVANPGQLLEMIGPLVLFYFSGYLIATILGRPMGRKRAVTMVFGSAVRNLSVALAIAVTVFPEKGSGMALIIALAYIVQVQTAVWYSNLVPRIFREDKSPLYGMVTKEKGQD
ncbi:MAG: arsenic resistance protein [Spirochaetales bacterium]|nr:arsenic resistance protein [Spirochaetales bacterium]